MTSSDHCPRCRGFAVPVHVSDPEADIFARRCLNCGWVGDEPLLDLHHALETPPEPRREVSTPIFDPRHRRLVYVPMDSDEEVA